MVGRRRCTFTMSDGHLCRAAPLVGGTFCRFHEPAKAHEVAERRRLGGLHRRREKAITEIYSLEGLDTVAGIRRLLDIAVTDALGLENSIARERILISVAAAAAKLIEPGKDEALTNSFGPAVGTKRRNGHDPSGFEDDPDPGELGP
ncbi:MAG TPA: hypothetical protein VGE81_00940 [Candidatus Limnocylindrales bacterium]